MSFGIAGICSCISIGLVTASPRVQHPLAARQEKKPVTGLGTCTGQGDSSSRTEQIQEKSKPWKPKWSSGSSPFAAGMWKRLAAHTSGALGWLISTLQHFCRPDKTIMMSAVEQVFWFFSQQRGKCESTELLEQFTVLSGLKMRSWKQLGGRGDTSSEEPGLSRAGSSSSSKMLVQPREEVSALPARNCSLCWHGQEEKHDGKQED